MLPVVVTIYIYTDIQAHKWALAVMVLVPLWKNGVNLLVHFENFICQQRHFHMSDKSCRVFGK